MYILVEKFFGVEYNGNTKKDEFGIQGIEFHNSVT